MAAGTPLAAYNARVRLATNVVCYATKWSVRPLVEEHDTSNFEGNQFANRIAGLKDIEYTVEGWWDSGANNFDAPLSIQVGVTLSNVFLYVSGTTGPAWSIPSSLITDTPHNADVHGLITFSFTAKGKGAYVYPTGNVS
jgi:hypothetical protein